MAANTVKIEGVRDCRFDSAVAMITVDLDNNDSYALRVVPDSIGNVYVWVEHRPKSGNWHKIFEASNGKQR